MQASQGVMQLIGQLIIFVLGVIGLNLAQAEPIRIVCFGGSNTYGKNLAREDAYPAQLQALLRANGYDVVVSNQGTNGQTTFDEVTKLNSAVPEGTAIVIFQPGGNDRRKGGNTEDNIRTIVQALLNRNIGVIFSGSGTKQKIVESFDVLKINELSHLAPDDMQGDREHLTPQGYGIVANRLLPLIEKLIRKTRM